MLRVGPGRSEPEEHKDRDRLKLTLRTVPPLGCAVVKPVHPTIRLPAYLAAAALLVLAIGPAQDAGGADRSAAGARAPIVKTQKIAPGLTYIRIVRRQLPLRTFVLRVDLSKAITLDTTIADDALPSRRQLSRIVRNHGALAGVNGDLDEGVGNTVHPFAQDGDLLHTAGPDAEMFAVSKDESSTFLGNPKLKVTVTDVSNGRVFTLDRWNRRAPEPGEIVGFSPVGGTLAAPPPFSCSVRLAPQGPPRSPPRTAWTATTPSTPRPVPSRPSTPTGVS